MGFVKETFLYCDICGENYGADHRTLGWGAAKLRNERGYFRYINKKDICEACFESGKHKEPDHE